MINVFVTTKDRVAPPYILGAVDAETVICSANMRESDLDALKEGDTFGAWRNDSDEYIRVRVTEKGYEEDPR